jgi:hypothetical protein
MEIKPGVTGRAPDVTDRTECETMSVPEAGRRYFGMSRNAAYMAAARGELPTVRIGRLLRVPVRAMERMLENAGKRPGVG